MYSRDAADAVASEAADFASTESEIVRLRRQYGDFSARAVLQAMIRDEFPGRVMVLSSFGTESAVILSLAAEVDPATPVIFLDTGKHFPETLAYRDRLIDRLGLTNVQSLTPDRIDLDQEDADGRLHGEDADRCCHIRKVLPLERRMTGYEAWITGRKRYQGGERGTLETLEAVDSRIKINPLARWTAAEIAAEFHRRHLPLHPLSGRGFLSVGCAPCTTRVGSGQTSRSGRWADSIKTECGIHRAGWARARQSTS